VCVCVCEREKASSSFRLYGLNTHIYIYIHLYLQISMIFLSMFEFGKEITIAPMSIDSSDGTSECLEREGRRRSLSIPKSNLVPKNSPSLSLSLDVDKCQTMDLPSLRQQAQLTNPHKRNFKALFN
jgi:hypothetical protein